MDPNAKKNEALFANLAGITNRPIIVDSNILLYCEGYDFKKKVRNLLRALYDNSNRLVLSEVSSFEVLKNVRDPKQLPYFVGLVNYLGKISLDRTAVNNAFNLFRVYQLHNLAPKNDSCDCLIGGVTISIKDSLLFTANRQHFPEPVWQTVRTSFIRYKPKDLYSFINLYLLEPNLDLISQSLE